MRQEPLTTADDTRNFEQRLEEIEAIVADLESGKLSLDEMLLRYESGMKLIDACQQRLATAELKVTEIAEATSLNSHASDEWPDSDDE
ncbi:MAG: exodeoxyribonuclease VII small subunit [Chloroflexia bacterium]|jgi:exodeoxyribonuclease VII small subunit|nr:exodeoxyribonuclease VII small subunit [Chloroflexia bacterium]